MNIPMSQLRKNALFQQMTEEEIRELVDLSSCTLEVYEKDTLVVQENDPCSTLGVVLEGKLHIQQYDRSGDALTINVFRHGDCFGAPLLFTPHPLYPFTLLTLTPSTVLFIPFEQLTRMLRENPTFNHNYLAFLSRHILVLKNKIKILSHNDVRSRLMIYLSREMDLAESPRFTLRHKKTEIAEIIKVARPSVSRELTNMERDGLLELRGQQVEILLPEEFIL
ncbi:Crp/Fnr family transcriptional regulator [Proteiniclasticum sp. BAD-10]|uniref:Crp/Fnr family transcriptional regulator n=1 Tax=Proteiniclasticum sediminis TaxID=2804028 RepID=A0A941CSS0_9CLOT|nr:Crp/Fnr family transcriptional regulator [Proteiniclasticum sediminis]MBR0576696.1 Crp/Fnr family transcriptional regulator [Proteiniclasticum sediminis]